MVESCFSLRRNQRIPSRLQSFSYLLLFSASESTRNVLIYKTSVLYGWKQFWKVVIENYSSSVQDFYRYIQERDHKPEITSKKIMRKQVIYLFDKYVETPHPHPFWNDPSDIMSNLKQKSVFNYSSLLKPFFFSNVCFQDANIKLTSQSRTFIMLYPGPNKDLFSFDWQTNGDKSPSFQRLSPEQKPLAGCISVIAGRKFGWTGRSEERNHKSGINVKLGEGRGVNWKNLAK